MVVVSSLSVNSTISLSGASVLFSLGNVTFGNDATVKLSGGSYINSSQCLIFNSKTTVVVDKDNATNGEQRKIFTFDCIMGRDNIQLDNSCSNGMMSSIVGDSNNLFVLFSGCVEWWWFLVIGGIVLVVVVVLILILGVPNIREKIFPFSRMEQISKK